MTWACEGLHSKHSVYISLNGHNITTPAEVQSGILLWLFCSNNLSLLHKTPDTGSTEEMNLHTHMISRPLGVQQQLYSFHWKSAAAKLSQNTLYTQNYHNSASSSEHKTQQFLESPQSLVAWQEKKLPAGLLIGMNAYIRTFLTSHLGHHIPGFMNQYIGLCMSTLDPGTLNSQIWSLSYPHFQFFIFLFHLFKSLWGKRAKSDIHWINHGETIEFSVLSPCIRSCVSGSSSREKASAN